MGCCGEPWVQGRELLHPKLERILQEAYRDGRQVETEAQRKREVQLGRQAGSSQTSVSTAALCGFCRDVVALMKQPPPAHCLPLSAQHILFGLPLGIPGHPFLSLPSTNNQPVQFRPGLGENSDGKGWKKPREPQDVSDHHQRLNLYPPSGWEVLEQTHRVGSHSNLCSPESSDTQAPFD